MKTKEELTPETGEILRVMSLYGVLELRQVLELYPAKSETLRSLIAHLVKNRRLYLQQGYVKARPELSPNAAVLAAFWVLLDFIHKGCVEYHTISDFSVAINFFANEESYDIIVAAAANESVLCHALQYGARDDSKRIVIVEDAGQIKACRIPGAFLYCTVSAGGQVHYYQKACK